MSSYGTVYHHDGDREHRGYSHVQDKYPINNTYPYQRGYPPDT